MQKSNTTKILTIDEIDKTLEQVTKVSDELHIPYGQIKPCIAKIMEEGLQQGGFPNRAEGGFVIACELRRIGVAADEILTLLRKWNCKNKPVLRFSKLQSMAKTPVKEYKYTCKNPNLEANCIGSEICSFSKLSTKRSKYYNNRKFLDYGWQNILSNVAIMVYYIAFPELERRLGVGAGGIIFANHRRIAYFAGVSLKSVGIGLRELEATPLLARCKIGTPRKWEKKASEVQRKIPIPKPPDNLIKK